MSRFIAVTTCFLTLLLAAGTVSAAEFQGTIVDANTGDPLPARVYLQSAGGKWLFVKTADPEGSAVPYREEWVPKPEAVEKHTTVSAHPFKIDLPPGGYSLTVERGKEYVPHTEEFSIEENPLERTVKLRRFVNAASRGWFSGETHVHRRIQELPNVMLAEDLNVAFPVTFWTIEAYTAPDLEPSPLRRQGPSPFGPRKDKGANPIEIDETHVIYPRNTEYEIFSVDDKRHVLGAVFILNHRSKFRIGMPPVKRIAEQAHREGALLDLDKHNWPWAMMLVPVAKIDLYELSNNSVWRTNFGFKRSNTAPAEYMHLEKTEQGFTERGWLEFGFQNYYALLNCGFRLKPTAGTASGVHPVPLGYSRVYVHMDGPFSGQKWLDGLRAGRSFVTNGPLLFARVNDKLPGHVFQQDERETTEYSVSGETHSVRPLSKIEVLAHGKVVRTIVPQNHKTKAGGYASPFDVTVPLAETSWIAVRCFEPQPDGRERFAHTGPFHVEVAGRPIRPRKWEVEFLIRRVREQIERNKDVLAEEALAEFREALAVYEEIAKRK